MLTQRMDTDSSDNLEAARSRSTSRPIEAWFAARRDGGRERSKEGAT